MHVCASREDYWDSAGVEGECMYVRAGKITGIQLGWKVSACMCEQGRLLGFSWGGR